MTTVVTSENKEAIMPFKIKVDCEVDDQFILDVLTTAIEQGTPWAVLRAVGKVEDLFIIYAEVADRDEEEGMRTWMPVTPAVIVKGIERILNGDVPIRSDLHGQVARGVAANDPDIDADAADCIVQAALFDALVFS